MSGQFSLGGNNPMVSAASGSNTPTFTSESHLGHAPSSSLGGTNSPAPFGDSNQSELAKPREGQTRRGVCKFFNSQKGFGFVLDNNAEELGGQEGPAFFTY